MRSVTSHPGHITNRRMGFAISFFRALAAQSKRGIYGRTAPVFFFLFFFQSSRRVCEDLSPADPPLPSCSIAPSAAPLRSDRGGTNRDSLSLAPPNRPPPRPLESSQLHSSFYKELLRGPKVDNAHLIEARARASRTKIYHEPSYLQTYLVASPSHIQLVIEMSECE